MTADHPTCEERYAAVIEAHLWDHTPTRRCVCGWNADPYTAGDPVEQHCAHVAAALVAADPAPAQPDAALSDALAKWTGCWCGEQQYPDHDPRVRDCPQHGSDDCRHMAEGIAVDLRAVLAARAAQPVPAPEVCHEFIDTGDCGHSDAEHDAMADGVPAPEVSRGVAEAWDEGFAAGAESAYRGDDPADRVNPYALPADDGAEGGQA